MPSRPWGRGGARYDASAAFGMPAHITVLYPFLPEDRLNQNVVDRLKEICADTHVLDVELREARRFPGMLYLAPEPDDGFRRLDRGGRAGVAPRRRHTAAPTTTTFRISRSPKTSATTSSTTSTKRSLLRCPSIPA